MKKIMFNDKYGLTQAVLDGRKTQTRRVISLTDTDKEYLNTEFDWELHEFVIIGRYAKYKVGEVVAVAQAYKDIPSIANSNFVGVNWDRASRNKPFGKWGCSSKLPGWKNKMFVRADQMPHHIRITNIRVEKLQDISDEDCLAEGVYLDYSDIDWDEGDEPNVCYRARLGKEFNNPRDAFSALIDKVSSKGTWNSNPYVFVYEFELVDQKGGYR